MSPLRVGIIGAGQVAETAHLPGYKSLSELIEVVGVCDVNHERARYLASKFNIANSFTDMEEMLTHLAPDIVSICTPNRFHKAGVMRSLDAGCHVLCEKPPALSFADAAEMELKATQTRRFLGYNLHYRQMNEIETLKRYIASGDFGTIYHVKATFLRRRGIPGWGSFTNKEIQGGGALIDIGIHVLDLALYLLDYPDVDVALGSVYDYIGKSGGVGLMGSWDAEKFSVEDACFAHIKTKRGSSITLETAFALNTESKSVFNLEIFGSKAGASLLPLKIFKEENSELVNITFPFIGEVNRYEKNIHRFVEACQARDTSVCNASQGTTLQKIIDMIYHTATGTAV